MLRHTQALNATKTEGAVPKTKAGVVEGTILFTVLVATSPCAVLAQQPSWAAVEQAKGQTITVVRNDSHSQTGSLERTSGDSLTITARSGNSVIAREDIRRVYVRESRSRKRGALWGLALGGGGGAIFGAATNHSCTSSSFCIDVVSRGESTAIGALGGAVAGGLVGALVGGGHKKILLYDRETAVSARQPSMTRGADNSAIKEMITY